MGIVLTGPQMRKKPVKPSTVSYVAQGAQQTTIAPHTNLLTILIKDQAISDSH